MHKFNNPNFLHNLGVVLFMAAIAFVLIAARKATASPADADNTFAMKAASGGMSEVKLGQLAAEKGTNPAVKQFGERMVSDHSKANDELKSVASQNNMTLPTDVSKTDAAVYERLSKLSGTEFDKAYAREMVKDHEQDIAEFQKESTTGKNPAVKEFASKTLPTLQSHLQEARQMQKAVMSSSSSAGM
jgi:putative membrane protein